MNENIYRHWDNHIEIFYLHTNRCVIQMIIKTSRFTQLCFQIEISINFDKDARII